MPTRPPKPLSQTLNQNVTFGPTRSTQSSGFTNQSSPTETVDSDSIPNKSSSTVNVGSVSGLSRISGIPPVDYKPVLTNFFKENAPEKLAEVDSLLQKYKVREYTGAIVGKLFILGQHLMFLLTNICQFHLSRTKKRKCFQGWRNDSRNQML